uniref:DNA cytosine methyltransferase n=1 Tax=Xanthomonas albilineans TaxID=29447 RepID=UPI0027DDE04D|nr:DNA cytosine methyltransferase [Xanthomonas albilineans]
MRYLSLFSGLEAAHLALSPLGWECAGVAEIDAAACAVLRHRLPHVPNLGNVTEITDAAIAQLGALDVVIGGSPCQDLSVAGKRAGLAGTRSSLFHEQLRIFHAARTLCGARWILWENVPGAFSSNKGRDFAAVVGALAGSRFAVPEDGWSDEGVALGDHGLVEWSVLDAQWFGVAQRRRRVFAVLDVGNWADRPPILLEPDRLRGDSAPRREAWESVASALACRVDRGSSRDERNNLIAFGGNNTNGPIEVSACLNACASASGRMDFESETFLMQTVSGTFGCKDSDPARSASDDVAPTLRAMGHAGSQANAGGQVGVVIGCDTYNGALTGDVAATLGTQSGDGLSSGPSVVQSAQVRRLTPIECERLQGVPDSWTRVPNARGKPMADGPRYKMLGNSFAVPVIRWIGEQIQTAHACEKVTQQVVA